MVEIMLKKGIKTVVIVDIRPPKDMVVDGQKVVFQQCDVSDNAQLEKLHKELTDKVHLHQYGIVYLLLVEHQAYYLN